MKFKLDFVTNSSSESFTTVIADTIPVVIASGALTTMMTAAKLAFIGEDASKQAQEIAEAVAEEADAQAKAVMDGYTDAEDTLDSEKQKLQTEIDEYKKQWAESESTADKTDPGYDKVNKQYEEYIKYLESQIQEKDYQKYIIQVQKAESQAEVESKNEWNRQRQVDLIATKEETALLKATLAGYKSDGFDVSNIEERLEQLKERETELTKTLAHNNASIDYTAKDRGVIGAGGEFAKLKKDYDLKMYQLDIAKGLANDIKRAEIEAKIEAAQAEYEAAMVSATRWDMATKAAEGVQFGADAAIDGLALVTGPAGQKIKLAYKAGKNVAEGMGEGMADPKNAGKHLAKGLIGAATEVVTDSLGESKVKSAMVNAISEGAKSALDAGIAGKDTADIIKDGLKGAGKSVIDSGVDSVLDKVKDKLPIPKGTSVDVGGFSVGQVCNNNPLSKGLAKTITREQLVDRGKGAIKDAITGKINTSIGLEAPEE